ncbi:MAG: helix-turn-helix domain-containing protein [Micrococcus sp.]|nr:helix-turn-helix domain-containing protein [Micrococcus sp.]
MPTKLLTVRDVADRLRLSEYTVRQKLNARQIRGVQDGPRSPWRVTESALEHYIRKNTR